MKTILLLLTGVLSMELGYAQIDQDKMNKDLEVAENILSTLIRQSSREDFVFMSRNRSVEGKYLPNFGVIFEIKANHFPVAVAIGGHKDEDNDEDVDESEVHNPLESNVRDFLADYGHLIRQLKPQEKIMVKTDGRSGKESWDVWDNQKRIEIDQSLSAEVAKSDLMLFEEGKLSREALMAKIQVQTQSTDYSKEPQLEVFASMLKRLYDSDMSKTYYMSSTPDYDRLESFGVTYYIKVYSSMVHDNDNYSLPTVDRKNVSKAERDKIVEGMYPEFLNSFKLNILDYGHILKNVKPEEMLVFRIRLTSCEGCQMPKTIEITAKKSVIDEYRNGSLGAEKALSMLEVRDVES